MHALTRYVLETALDQYVRWRADGLDLQISVNLSPTNCMDTQLPADLLAMLEARELPPRVLRLEVTEYAACACWAPTASKGTSCAAPCRPAPSPAGSAKPDAHSPHRPPDPGLPVP